MKKVKLEERLSNMTRGSASGEGAIMPKAGESARVPVAKAYKMFVGGAFIRSESGRYFQTKGHEGDDSADPATVNVPLGSRKDVRDAVLAAKNAQKGWASRTAFNRGQILYRLAEMIESRRDELVGSLMRGGLDEDEALREVDACVDRSVYYAGFADKYHSLVASSNPVAGPHFGFSIPEPMGVVGVLAPERPVLLGLVSTILPIIVSGNTVVVLSSEADPRSTVLLCECFATSDLPGGVVNVLTGKPGEMAPHLAKHREVMAIDAYSDDATLLASIEKDGAGNVKRVKTTATARGNRFKDDDRSQGLSFIERFLETKTVWHPVGV
jgi:acyl-CoA reductase-like NAD-dependent aldehyde dehydrogenase